MNKRPNPEKEAKKARKLRKQKQLFMMGAAFSQDNPNANIDHLWMVYDNSHGRTIH